MPLTLSAKAFRPRLSKTSAALNATTINTPANASHLICRCSTPPARRKRAITTMTDAIIVTASRALPEASATSNARLATVVPYGFGTPAAFSIGPGARARPTNVNTTAAAVNPAISREGPDRNWPSGNNTNRNGTMPRVGIHSQLSTHAAMVPPGSEPGSANKE